MFAVDKPVGWTSHDVVAVVRHAVGVRRVGHGGTLDPLATGVLPILVGRATRFVERLHSGRKVYAALVRFGTETTTDDAEGDERSSAHLPDLDVRALDRALDRFRGDVVQVPPERSSVKIGGRRAYAISRAGEEVRPPPRTVRIDRLEIASWRPPALRVVIVCGSGTYVRALARDLGRALGSSAHLGALRRLAVGALSADDAVGMDGVRSGGTEGILARLRPADDRLLDLDGRYMTAPAAELLAGWEAA